MIDEFSVADTYKALYRQVNSYWETEFPEGFEDEVAYAIYETKQGWNESSRIYYKNRGFSILNTSLYSVFLYYLSHNVGMKGGEQLADKLYYLNKIMNCVELYWNIDLPQHFITEHPLGSVLGKARYGDYFSIYQGITVGERLSKSITEWPELGHHVTMFAHSSIIGKCNIGNWVIIGANTHIINQDVPDCSLVFGESPSLIIKQCGQEKIKEYYVKSWSSRT